MPRGGWAWPSIFGDENRPLIAAAVVQVDPPARQAVLAIGTCPLALSAFRPGKRGAPGILEELTQDLVQLSTDVVESDAVTRVVFVTAIGEF